MTTNRPAAPDGYYWKTGVFDDEEYGWTGFANLYKTEETVQSKWWRSTVGTAPHYSGRAVNYNNTPEELIAVAMQHCLDYYADDMKRKERDELFRNYGKH